jgi:L-lactate dehydrogenase complex protein LldG
MKSRANILAAVKANQPTLSELPLLDSFLHPAPVDLIEQFSKVLVSIGGTVTAVKHTADIIAYLKANDLVKGAMVVSPLPSMQEIVDADIHALDPHNLADVGLAILPAHFAVAENGACWISDTLLTERVLPFITQHLVLIVNQTAILPTMHHAYERIGDEQYGFATFIAGPSKTADIEQSLVLGAHGARSLWVFILQE